MRGQAASSDAVVTPACCAACSVATSVGSPIKAPSAPGLASLLSAMARVRACHTGSPSASRGGICRRSVPTTTTLDAHGVLGERAGLVATDRGDRAHGLDCRQAPHQGVARGHALGPQSEGDRDDPPAAPPAPAATARLIAVRNISSGGSPSQQTSEQDDQADHENTQRQPTTKGGEPLLERRWRPLALAHQRGDTSQFRSIANRHDQTAGVTGGHIGPLEDHVHAIAEGRFGVRERRRQS